MRYKEFEEQVEVWGRKHGYATEVSIGDFEIVLKIKSNGELYFTSHISSTHRFVLDTDWAMFLKIKIQAREELFDILVDLAKTPPEDRKDEKRFIVPLPELITSDGKQQYLTHKDGKFFASRRDETLQQIWEEEDLELIPEQYRQFAMEFDDDKEY